MKTIIIAASLVLSASAVMPAPAEAQAFYSVRSLLANHFRGAQRVSFVRVQPDEAARTRISRRLSQSLPRSEYTFYVAHSAQGVQGYALFDDELGQHENISFVTFFDAHGKVVRVEVVAYREPFGHEIRAERFREQFVGRTATSGFRAGRDIDSISGATISSRSMCRGVHRATVLLEELVLSRPPQGALASR